MRVTPSSPRGARKGPTFAARAVPLHGDEARRASDLLRRRYPFVHGVLVPMTHRRRKVRTVHYELVDFAEPTAP
ncbi:MAG TPA: hypothetical protein VHB30_02325 [Solirubrobacteraceae bacterium]|nr:hypothetical protein [Solirubrobacteraceae bacterium]